MSESSERNFDRTHEGTYEHSYQLKCKNKHRVKQNY